MDRDKNEAMLISGFFDGEPGKMVLPLLSGLETVSPCSGNVAVIDHPAHSHVPIAIPIKTGRKIRPISRLVVTVIC